MPILDLPSSVITSLHAYCYIPQRVCRQLDLKSEQQWHLVNTWLKWLYSEGWLTPIYQIISELGPFRRAESPEGQGPLGLHDPSFLDQIVLYQRESYLPHPEPVEINRLFQIYIHHFNFVEASEGRKINRSLLCQGLDHQFSYIPLLQGLIWLGGTPSLSCLDLFDHIVRQRNPLMETQIVIPVLVTATSNKYWLIRASLTALVTANGAVLRQIWQDPKIIRQTDYYALLLGTLQQYFNQNVVNPQFHVDLGLLIQLVTMGLTLEPPAFAVPPVLSIDLNTNQPFWTFYRNQYQSTPFIEYVVESPSPLQFLQEWLIIDSNTNLPLKSKIPIRNEVQLSDLSSLQWDGIDDTSVTSRHSGDAGVSELDAITNQNLELLWEIYRHETERGSDKIGLDQDFLEAQIIKGLRYRPFLARVSEYLRWWPSRLIALIKEIEDYEELQSRFNIQPFFPIAEWESLYPVAFLSINNLSSETIWSSFTSFEAPHRTLEALDAVEVYLQSSNIASSKYPVVLERFGFNYQWNFVCTLYSNNYDLCRFVLWNHKDKIVRDTQANNRQLDIPAWTRLLMRNQAIGFLGLIFERFNFRHTGPRVPQTLYSGLLSALLQMRTVDLRVCDLLIRHNFSSWIVNFISMYGGYFSVESILSVIIHLSPSIVSDLFESLTSNFKCTKTGLPRADLVVGPELTSRLWRPEDLLLIFDSFDKSGHQLYLSQISNRDDRDSITWLLDSLRSLKDVRSNDAILDFQAPQTSQDNSDPRRKRKREHTIDSQSNTRHKK
jgi:hypothetical protein